MKSKSIYGHFSVSLEFSETCWFKGEGARHLWSVHAVGEANSRSLTETVAHHCSIGGVVKVAAGHWDILHEQECQGDTKQIFHRHEANSSPSLCFLELTGLCDLRPNGSYNWFMLMSISRDILYVAWGCSWTSTRTGYHRRCIVKLYVGKGCINN